MAGTVAGEITTPELARFTSYATAFGVLTAVSAVALAVLVAFEVREAAMRAPHEDAPRTQADGGGAQSEDAGLSLTSGSTLRTKLLP